MYQSEEEVLRNAQVNVPKVQKHYKQNILIIEPPFFNCK